MADGLTIGQAAAFAGVTVKIPPGVVSAGAGPASGGCRLAGAQLPTPALAALRYPPPRFPALLAHAPPPNTRDHQERRRGSSVASCGPPLASVGRGGTGPRLRGF
jgi:hypothetical protein